MSSTESRVSTKKAGIPMRTETEMMNLILQIAESLKVEAVALSGSRTDTKAPKDEFQDYDIVSNKQSCLVGPVWHSYH